MAKIIPFPVALRAAQIGRSRRVFEAQRELELAQRHGLHLGLLVFGTSAIVLGILELVALGVLH